MPSKESGLCPETVSNSAWMGGLRQLPGPVLTAWASLRFSGSKTTPQQVLWSDQITLFLAGRKARIQDHTTLEQNLAPKMLWVIPVGGRQAACSRGPCLLLVCSCLSPVLNPPVPFHISPAGSQEGSTGPGMASGVMLPHVAQVRPRPELVLPLHPTENLGSGAESQHALAVILVHPQEPAGRTYPFLKPM